MAKQKEFDRIIPIMIIIFTILLSGCSVGDNIADPSDWDYSCIVTYNALGGAINTREIRETYYMKNSYVFKPSGTTNMLIEPVKDGYLLAGWYTAKEDVLDDAGNVIGYKFDPQDRWDFDEDRVQESMTLYARWIPQGRVEYLDPVADKVVFAKNITASSPVQELSSAVGSLISKPGYTFYGYYADSEFTTPYQFAEYVHSPLIPTNVEIYAQLHPEFPQYINEKEYVEPDEDSKDILTDTSDLFINKIGYEITADETQRAEIHARKNEIYEEAINNYMINTADKVVYLKYIEGTYARIGSVDDLKQGANIVFSGLNRNGEELDGYIIANDLDFKDSTVEISPNFSGKIFGNDNSLKNLSINVSSRKVDMDKSKSVGLFLKLDGAYIENLSFENLTIKTNINAGIDVTIGALAVEANNTELKNITFDGLTIETGKGDDGSASYKIYDLFAKQNKVTLENIKGTGISINASEWAQVNQSLEPIESVELGN